MSPLRNQISPRVAEGPASTPVFRNLEGTGADFCPTAAGLEGTGADFCPTAAGLEACPTAATGADAAATAAEHKPNSSFRPTLFLISGRMLAFVVTFFIPIVLSRVFDLQTFGAYKQVFLVYFTLYGIAQMGMAESLYYFLPNDQARGGRYVCNAMLILALSGGACLFLVASGSSAIGRWVGIEHFSSHVLMVCLFLGLMLISTVFEIAMISRGRYPRAAGVYAASDMLRTAFMLLPAFIFHSLDWLLRGLVAFAVLRLAGSVWYLWKEFGSELRFDLALLRRQLAYALPFELAVIVDIAQANLHQYAVSAFFPVAVFAVYTVGCLQLPFVDLVASPACNVMMVRMGQELRAGRDRAVLHLWHDTTRKLALIFVPIFVLLVVSARQIIEFLFPAQFIGAVPIFKLWSLIVVLAVFQTDGLMRVYARTGFLVFLNAVRLAVVVALMGLCLRVWGLSGAVLVTLVATVASKTIAIARGARLMRVSFARVLPWGRLAAIGGAAAAAALPALLIRGEVSFNFLVVGTHMSLQKLTLLGAMGTAYVVCYAAILLGFDLLDASEKAAITSLFRRRQPAVANGD